MRRFCVAVGLFLAAFPSYAQQEQLYTGFQDDGVILEAPPSDSLELFRQANKKYEISVGAPTSTTNTPVPIQMQPPAGKQASSETSAAKRPSSTQKAATPAVTQKTATVSPVVQEPSATSKAPAVQNIPTLQNTQAQNVQTTVPEQSTSGGQVAAVSEVKTLSPSVIQRISAAKEMRAKTESSTPAAVPAEQVALPPKKSEPTELEKNIEKHNGLLPEGMRASDEEAESEKEAAADAELEYAVRMLEKSKEEASNSGRTIPPPAAKNKPATVPTPNKKFNPNAFRPGVEWVFSKSTHFDIYTQKTSGVGAGNMSLMVEGAYETLRRFIPWMLSGRVRVFVYQDHNSYLKFEPEAKAWTRALAYPTRGEIVIYNEPGKAKELKEVFTHELTHIFTQNFFDKHHTGKIMTPTWLDEGLAVLVEDQAYSGSRGGPWNHDYQTLNLQRDQSQEPTSFSSRSMFGSSFKSRRSNGMGARNGAGRRGAPVVLTPFEDFMREGSLETAEGKEKTQQWYLQAYLMVRFLLNPAGGSSPSNRMQFEQFTRLMAEGEAVRNPSTGFLVKDKKGKVVYRPYSTEKALSRSYHYSTTANFEDAFWKWMKQ